MNKTITLTPDEAEFIQNATTEVYERIDLSLRNRNYARPQHKEKDIETVHTAESILKKLEAK